MHVIDKNSNEYRNTIRCPVCGAPWRDHPTDTVCDRYRPGTTEPRRELVEAIVSETAPTNGKHS